MGHTSLRLLHQLSARQQRMALQAEPKETSKGDDSYSRIEAPVREGEEGKGGGERFPSSHVCLLTMTWCQASQTEASL